MLQLLAGKNKSRIDSKNFVEISQMVGPKASDVAASAGVSTGYNFRLID